MEKALLMVVFWLISGLSVVSCQSEENIESQHNDTAEVITAYSAFLASVQTARNTIDIQVRNKASTTVNLKKGLAATLRFWFEARNPTVGYSSSFTSKMA